MRNALALLSAGGVFRTLRMTQILHQYGSREGHIFSGRSLGHSSHWRTPRILTNAPTQSRF
jgi:hypothetical protein